MYVFWAVIIYVFIIPLQDINLNTEVRIYKRKQESKKKRKKERKQELDEESDQEKKDFF